MFLVLLDPFYFEEQGLKLRFHKLIIALRNMVQILIRHNPSVENFSKIAKKIVPIKKNFLDFSPEMGLKKTNNKTNLF